MAALNHPIVWSRDKHTSAKFLGDMLGVDVCAEWGPFVPIDHAELDAAVARIKSAGLPYWADPHKEQPGEINHHRGGRGVYFDDPNSDLLELITKPYGDLADL